MSTDQMRADFEAYYSRHTNKIKLDRGRDGRYYAENAEDEWEVWQAAVASVRAKIDQPATPSQDESCAQCGAPVSIKLLEETRGLPRMWQARCSGDCLDPSFTRFEREGAVASWNNRMRSVKSIPTSSSS